MPRTKKKSPDSAQEITTPDITPAAAGIPLEGELTIYQVAQVKAVLQEALVAAKVSSKPLQLNLSALTDCDGAGLQLLLALAKTLQTAEISLVLSGTPPNITAIFERYGVTGYFSHATEGAAL